MRIAFAIATLALLAAGKASTAEPEAGITSQSQIEQALEPQPKTRGLRLRATSENSKSGEGIAVAAPVDDGKIDLNVPFGLNSAELGPQAVVQLEQLQQALKSSALAQSRFLIAGHTDAKGDARRNQDLSLRRAKAVTTYLIARGVDATHLQAEGQGESQLLTPDDPENGVNRRVEIRNLGGTQ
ncbi:MAG: OmpA family protein [Steroidobacteraceae bacterium]